MLRSAKWLVFISGWVMCCSMVSAQDAALEAKNQKLVTDWYREVIAFGHVDLASKYMADDYIEHDPNLIGDKPVGGTKEFVAFHGKNPPRPIQAALPVKPVQSFAKGDYVIMAWEHDDKDPKSGTPYKFITYDITRVKNGKIQEHWDSLKKN
jgi:predicted SnoaL-like aldol condensation-catalyzing enzyme